MPDTTRKETFEVVMIKNGRTEQSAAIEDFRRVRVEASDPLQAFTHEDVQKIEGYYPILTAKPGVLTDPEVHARRRSFEASSGPTRLPAGDNPFAMTPAEVKK